MHLNTETADLRDLIVSLNQAGGDFTPQLAGRILIDAAKPLLIAEQQEVPVGDIPQYQSGAVVRGIRKGKPRTNIGTYARGGALRRSLRLKAVNPEGKEQARVIVGASKRTGQAGWRAHFIINGTQKMPPNNYQDRAYQRTKDVVENRVETSALVVIKKRLAKYQK